MTTARDIVKSALRKISVVGTGAPMSNEDAQDGLSTLNSMLASFSVEGDVTYVDFVEEFGLTGGVGEYTIGSGGDFNTGIPTEIKAMTYKTGTIEYSLSQYSATQYAGIPLKSTQGIPYVYWFDSSYPLAKIRLYYVPSTNGTLTIYSTKPLTEFIDLDSDYVFPAEYLSMLEYNLAVWIAPEYEREAPATVKQVANRTYTAIQAANKRNKIPISSLDVPTSENSYGYGNINGGYE